MTQLPSMNINNMPQSGGNSDPVPVGLHTCRIIRIADVGTIPNQYRPQDAPKHKLRVGFEVTDFQVQWNNNGQMVMGNALAYKTITVSSGEKAILTSLFCAADPTGQQTNGEIWNLVGLPLLVQFAPIKDNQGGTYIHSFAPLMQGMQVPPPSVETWCFSVAAPDPAVWAKLNNTIKDMVKSNVNGGAQLFAQMEAATGNGTAPGQQGYPQQQQPPAQPQMSPQQPAQPAYQAEPQAQPQMPQYQAPPQQQAPAQAQPGFQQPGPGAYQGAPAQGQTTAPSQGYQNAPQNGFNPAQNGNSMAGNTAPQQPQQAPQQGQWAQPQQPLPSPASAPMQPQGQPQQGYQNVGGGQPVANGAMPTQDFDDDIPF